MKRKTDNGILESLFFAGCILALVVGTFLLYQELYSPSLSFSHPPPISSGSPYSSSGLFTTYTTGLPCCGDDLMYIWQTSQQEKESEDYRETFSYLRAKERYYKYYASYYEPFPPVFVAYEEERIHYTDLDDYKEVHEYESYIGPGPT
ncbi:hypothetical protein COY95_00830 [Candidatus Woesearchaeota archaeon CG_4_10_14_0_8_um_filter_47_5]|nr:MAG: hypothetical protein COY95_00830 [Candidatus Woesearchaeota archaeon CG_4_10_14_0_8_um_filter_47_5]